MIDQVSLPVSYPGFFSECAASNCTYSLNERQNIILIITSLIGIGSGLSVALRLVTPFLFHIVYWSLGLVQSKQETFRIFSLILHKHEERLYRYSASTETKSEPII